MKLHIVLGVLLLCLATPAFATPAFVQATISGPCTATSLAHPTVTLPSPVGSGNFVFGMVEMGNVTSVLDVVDDQGAHYTLGDTITQDSQVLRVFYLSNVTGGPTTFTVTAESTNSDFDRIVVAEYSGVTTGSPVDNAGAAHSSLGVQSGGGGPNSGTFTTSNNGDLVIGATADSQGNAAQGYSAGGGFTVRINDAGSGGCPMGLEDRVQATAGSTSATFTQSVDDNSVNFGLGIIAAAGGGGGATCGALMLVGAGC